MTDTTNFWNGDDAKMSSEHEARVNELKSKPNAVPHAPIRVYSPGFPQEDKETIARIAKALGDTASALRHLSEKISHRSAVVIQDCSITVGEGPAIDMRSNGDDPFLTVRGGIIDSRSDDQ